MSQFLSHSAEETEDFGFRLAQQLKGGEVIAMYGGMGMGKTAFTRGAGARIGDRAWYIQPYLCFGS